MDKVIPWAARTASLRPSAVRELLRLTRRPDMISLAGGLPAPELFPTAELATATQDVWQRLPSAALQYGETEGVPELRDWIATRFSSPRGALGRENVLVTTGAQQALDLLGRVLVDEGCRVAVENPTYLALLNAWRTNGAVYESLRNLDSSSNAAEPSTAWPRLAYVIPDFQNPTGRTWTLEERLALIESARRHRMLLIEDTAYRPLRYDGTPLPSLFELAQAERTAADPNHSRVIQVGTFSKTLAPGLRVGWVIGPRALIEKLAWAKQAMDLHTGTLSQWILYTALQAGILERQVPRLLAAYRTRRDVMLAALNRYLPLSATWQRPDGGLFVWVRLAAGLSSRDLLAEAIPSGVAFVPGQEFHWNGEGLDTLRLNFSHAAPEHLAEGIRRLGALLDAKCASSR